MIRQLLNLIELTAREQRVVIFALAALLAFVAVKTFRSGSSERAHEISAADSDQPSPSPGIRP